jgi:hypothetical protein
MVKEELARVIKSLEDAFDVPEYSGEISKGKLIDANADKILQTSIEQLDMLSKKYQSSPEIPFLSGIASRYLGNESRFQRMINLSHKIDPDYLEAQIAKTERERYLDPFCYPSIKDLKMNPGVIRPISRVFLKMEGAYIDLVRDGIRLIPIFMMKFEKKGNRPLPRLDMPNGLAVEICSVLPESMGIPNNWKWPIGNSKKLKQQTKPFLDVLSGKKHFTTILVVCPLLVNDPNDPFFNVVYINPSPIKLLSYPHDYQSFKGRYEGLRLCQSPYRTIFIFIDEQNTSLLLKEVDLNYVKLDLLNIGKVLKHFPTNPISLGEWKRAIEKHEKHFFYNITASNGHTYSIPKYRTGNERLNIIFSLEFRDGEIRAKREPGQVKQRELIYDIFISHSHDDQMIAYAITEWVLKRWPKVKLFMTSRDQYEIDEIVPGYYTLSLLGSKALMFIATLNSLRSSHALLELATASQNEIKVIGVCTEGTIVDVLKFKGLLGYFDRVVEITEKKAESLLSEWFCSTLNLPKPQNDQTGILAKLSKTPHYIPVPESSISNDEIHASIGIKIANKEILSKEEALKWLDIVEKNVLHKARMGGIPVEKLPRTEDVISRLAIVLISSDDTKYNEILQNFIPLLDDRFIQHLKLLHESCFKANDEKTAKTILKLLQASKGLINKVTKK